MKNENLQRLSFALKVAIVLLAGWYIATRIFHTKDLDDVLQNSLVSFHRSPILFFIVFMLMPVNWMLEAWKWKIVTEEHVKISFADAMKGVLSGVTMGTATPNRIGEFAGRIFMIKEGDRLALMLLSFICSFAQVTVTIVAGFAGIIFEIFRRDRPDYSELLFLLVPGILLCMLPFGLKLFPAKWKQKLHTLLDFPRKKLFQIIAISTVRYLVYTIQFFFLLKVNGAGLGACDGIALIMIAYLIVTLIPTFSVSEVLVRGSVAAFVFAMPGYDSTLGQKALVASVLVWFINVALPSLVGTVFVFRLKFFKKEK